MLERNKKVKAPQKTRAEHAEDALYREVWEEVNNEKTVQFIKKYSKHMMVAAFVILIIATSIQIGIRTHNAHKIATATAYEAAVESVDANALASLSENASGATADLALFQSYILDNDVAKLERLADSGNTRDFRDLARLHIIGLRGDDMSAADVEKYLSDFEKMEMDTDISLQEAFAAPREMRKQYSVSEGEELKENSYLSYNSINNIFKSVNSLCNFHFISNHN